jgi:hypothetical protein
MWSFWSIFESSVIGSIPPISTNIFIGCSVRALQSTKQNISVRLLWHQVNKFEKQWKKTKWKNKTCDVPPALSRLLIHPITAYWTIPLGFRSSSIKGGIIPIFKSSNLFWAIKHTHKVDGYIQNVILQSYKQEKKIEGYVRRIEMLRRAPTAKCRTRISRNLSLIQLMSIWGTPFSTIIALRLSVQSRQESMSHSFIQKYIVCSVGRNLWSDCQTRGMDR